MSLDDKRPIIVKKVKKAAHGHHGGAWKLAYADFVTAMMAFFLLMWLLGSTTEAQKKGIADYFQNPLKVSLSGGNTSGDTTSVLQGGGPDVRFDVGQTNQGNSDERPDIKEAPLGDETAIEPLEQLNRELKEAIDASPLLQQFKEQLLIDFTRDGLRIQIVDAQNRPMFALGSDRMEPYAQQILGQITPLIAKLSNKLSISGHTDATPFANNFRANGRNYGNWELSADRANAARRAMVAAGLPEAQVARSAGMAEVAPFDRANPRAPVNRRIAIVVLNARAERALLGLDEPPPGAGPDGTPAANLADPNSAAGFHVIGPGGADR